MSAQAHDDIFLGSNRPSMKKRAAKAVLLPGFIPRIRTLFANGFSTIATLVAFVFATVGLLPRSHPYLNPINKGQFGLRHVIAQAASNLKFTRDHIDQVILFGVIVVGLVMLFAQFILLIIALFAQQPALAQGISIENLFFVDSIYGHGSGGIAGDPAAQDIAFSLLDRIFGVQGIYESCVSTAQPCIDLHGNIISQGSTYPYPIHLALHKTLEFYSYGIFIVSVFVILYFVITIVAETASSGSPFGQRTNRVWTPIRLIVFFALLMPLNTTAAPGLNSAQLITLWTAKLGSNFATNAWGRFNQELTGTAGSTNQNTYIGQRNTLIATPEVPSINGLLQFLFVAKTCKIAEEATPAYHKIKGTTAGPHGGIQAYVVRPDTNSNSTQQQSAQLMSQTSYDQALALSDNGNIIVRFGLRRIDADAPQKYKSSWGSVYPYCGEVVISTNDLDAQGKPTSGSKAIQEIYYKLVRDIYHDNGFDMNSYASCVYFNAANTENYDPTCAENDFLPTEFFMTATLEKWNRDLNQEIKAAVSQQLDDDEAWAISDQLRQRGWAGAAIWYNRIAQMNGEVTTAIFSPPTITKYPSTMERVLRQKQSDNENIDLETIFAPIMGDGSPIDFENPSGDDLVIAETLNVAYEYWEKGDILTSHFEKGEKNLFINFINKIYGTSGLFTMRNNDGIHPLAKLSALGKAMMETSIRNLGVGFAASAGKSILPGTVGELAKPLSGFLKAIGWASFSMSFTMYYVLPFLPFIYFFFAVSGWVKGIFEAMVAMPLWALAHISIDGEGLPAQRAADGYFLLLDIFLRPILIVFGLLASITIFTEMVNVLDDIFNLVIANVAGFDFAANSTAPATEDLTEYMRNPVDRFFYTALYTIVVYLIGQNCFKLVDQIPNQILRWTGSNAQTYQESAGQSAEKVMSMSYMGTNVLSGQLKGGALALL